jgi:enoyl-CoA hydratase
MPIGETQEDGVLVLRMAQGKGNAINPPLIAALHEALDRAEASEARAVVLTGEGKVFSAGLDLVFCYELDRAGMARFTDAFDDLFLRLFRFPKPVVAAVNGHALAGGCILAMCADMRVMARGPFEMSINEVLLGIPFPAAAFEVARFALPPETRSEAFLTGRRYGPDEALAGRLVHGLAGDGGVLPDAIERARRFCAGSGAAVRAVKAELRGKTVARIEATRAESRARWLDVWFSDEARTRVGRLFDQLRGRAAG